MNTFLMIKGKSEKKRTDVKDEIFLSIEFVVFIYSSLSNTFFFSGTSLLLIFFRSVSRLVMRIQRVFFSNMKWH